MTHECQHFIYNLAYIPTFVFAARKVFHEHVGVATLADGGAGIHPEAFADGLGDYCESLTEFVDEAEREGPMGDGGAHEEDSWNLKCTMSRRD